MEKSGKDINETKKIVLRISEAQFEEKVRKRAYELFMSRKHPASSALDYWLAAEKEILEYYCSDENA
ncbi:MAG: DUF2934 domain-containing protein [Ignavibacteriaceae bacterium]